MKRFYLLGGFIALFAHASVADAKVRFGELLPERPAKIWPTLKQQRALLVIYSNTCDSDDLKKLWQALYASQKLNQQRKKQPLPVYALQVGAQIGSQTNSQVSAPPNISDDVWHGPQAATFAKSLRLVAYPTVILLEEGRIFYAWEGRFTGNSTDLTLPSTPTHLP